MDVQYCRVQLQCSLMQCPRTFVELGWWHSCIFCFFSIWGLFFTLHSCCCFSLVIQFLYFKLGLDAAPQFIGFSSCPFWVRLLFKHLVGRSSLLQLCAETMAYACKVISRTNFVKQSSHIIFFSFLIILYLNWRHYVKFWWCLLWALDLGSNVENSAEVQVQPL